MNESTVQPSSRRKGALIFFIIFLIVGGIYLLQRTPPLEVPRGGLLHLIPAPERGATFAGAADIPRLRSLARSRLWSRVLDETLLEHLAARGAFPPGAGPFNRGEMTRLVGLMNGEAGVLSTRGAKLAVVQLGFVGRVGYNLTRWLGPARGRALRMNYGATPGMALLHPDSAEPFLHVTMRGPYLFASPSEELVSTSLAIVEGSSDNDSLADQVRPLNVDEPAAHLTLAQLGPDRSPRLLSLELDPKGARARYHYVPREELPELPPQELLEPAGSIPKSAGIYLSTVWPPALVGSLSATTETLRNKTNDWLSWRTSNAPATLESVIERPVTFAAADWVEIPGHVPFPHLLMLARVKDRDRALETFDRALRASLHTRFTRLEAEASESPVIRYTNEVYLGAFAPSLSATGNRILLASTARFLDESLGAVEGHVPSLEDRAELAELEAFAGSRPLAALLFASGRDLAKLGSDLLLKLASDLPSTAADDARDLLVPTVEKLQHFHRIYGRLEVEEPSGNARFDLRFELDDSRERRN